MIQIYLFDRDMVGHDEDTTLNLNTEELKMFNDYEF